jgi:hypothetical protein
MPIRSFVLAGAFACLWLSLAATASARPVRAVAAPLTASRSLANASLPTPAAAAAIVKHLWAQREQALAALDVEGIGPVETASVRQADAAYVNAVRCGCEPKKDPHPLLQVVPQIPDASVAPAFFAQVRTTNTTSPDRRPWYLMVVTREGGAWKFAQLTFGGYGAAPPLRVVTRSGGTTPRVTAAAHARIVHLAQSAFGRGAAVVAPVSHTDYGATIHSHPALHARKDGIYGLALPAGKVLSCFTAHTVETYTLPSGVLQQNAARTQWGHDIAPGTYSSITVDNAVPLCVVGTGVGAARKGLGWTYDARVFASSGVRA